MLFPAPRGDSSKRFLDFFKQGDFRVVLDPASPHPLTTEGVRDAFNLMMSRRAKGKVVIAVLERES
jgi:NADPH:quinone reductase-like Zn-dependent oxidoreductase